MLKTLQTLPENSIETVINETMKEDLGPDEQAFIDYYAWYIVAEVKHFMKMNQLCKMKPKLSPDAQK